jgi:hypothetical protein
MFKKSKICFSSNGENRQFFSIQVQQLNKYAVPPRQRLKTLTAAIQRKVLYPPAFLYSNCFSYGVAALDYWK